MAEKLYTVAQAAEYLQCSLSTVRRRIREGDLTAIKNGRLVRIRESDLEKMLTGGNSSGMQEPVKEEPAEPVRKAAPLPDSWKH